MLKQRFVEKIPSSTNRTVFTLWKQRLNLPDAQEQSALAALCPQLPGG